MFTNCVRDVKNNHGFGVTWDLDVTVEGVPEEASGDYGHPRIVTDKENGKPRKYLVEEL